MKDVLSAALSVLGEPLTWLKGALIFLLGPINLQLMYLLLAIGIDLCFGVQIALREKTFKWKILFKKLRQKIVVYAMWISMFHAFDMVAGLPDSARWAVVVMLAGLEILSAIKNTAKLGHNRLAEGLERLYLTLTKSTATQKQPTQTTMGDALDAAKEEPKDLKGEGQDESTAKQKP